MTAIAFLLVIVNNLDVRWSRRSAQPVEANSPLIVNANTVLALAVADQRFEAIPGQGSNVPKRCGRFETVELQARGAVKSRKSLDAFAEGEISGPAVPIITCYVKRTFLAMVC